MNTVRMKKGIFDFIMCADKGGAASMLVQAPTTSLSAGLLERSMEKVETIAAKRKATAAIKIVRGMLTKSGKSDEL